MQVTPFLQQWVRRLLPLAIALNLLLLLYYVTIDYQVGLHADSAVMNLLAQEMRETRSFFPSSWYYANGDLWIATTQLPIAALLPFTKNTFALHAFSSLVCAALVLGSAWCVGGMLGQSRTARALLLLVLAGGISPNMAENLYGQGAYGVLFAYSCLLAVSGWRLLHAHGAARWRWGALFAVLALLVCWSNPQRALVFYALPLLAALALTQAPVLSAQRRGAVLLAALLLAAIVIGAVLHGAVVRQVGNSGLPPPTWLDFDGMVRNTLGTLRGLLSLLGGLPPAGAKVASSGGALDALRLCGALALLVLLPWAVWRALRTSQHDARRYFAMYTLTGAAINLLVALATSIPDMGSPEASVRYLVLALLGALVLLTGDAVDQLRRDRPATLAALAALLLLGLTPARNYHVPDVPRYFPRGGIVEYNLFGKIARFIAHQRLQRGYSTFWSAGTITVLSGHDLRQRPIAIDHGLPMPVRHLSSSRWYEGTQPAGVTYLMLNYDEVKQIDWNQLAAYLGQPVRVLDFAGCKFYIYDFDIATRLPLWNLQHGAALQVPVTAATQHHIGQLTDNGTALHSAAGEGGHLRFGSIVTPPPGDYLVSFDLETSGDGVAEYGMVDAATDNGAVLLANQPIKAQGRQRLSMPLTVPPLNGAQLELRVLSNGNGAITLRNIELNTTSGKQK
jgi:hypothetical protein